MKKARGTVILLAILIAIMLYMNLSGIAKRKNPYEEAAKAAALFDFKVADITRMEIEKEDGTDLVFERKGRRWKIEKPVTDDADTIAVEGLIRRISKLKYSRKLVPSSEKKLDWKALGLDPPRVTVKLEGKGKKYTLHVGEEAPVSSRIYVAKADKKAVYLVGDSIKYPLGNELEDFRRREIFDAEKTAVKKIIISRPGETVVLARVEDTWRLEEPVNDLAASSIAATLLNRTTSLRVSTFVNDHPKKLSPYGLDKPTYKLVVMLDDGSRQALLIGGRIPGKKQFYCKREDKPFVYAVSADIVDTITQKVTTFRSRKLVDVSSDDVDRIKISYADGQYVELQKEAKNAWKMTSPVNERADTHSVEHLIADVAGCTIKKFVKDSATDLAPYGLAKPAAVVTFHLKNGKSVGVSIGKTDDTGTLCYVMRTGSEHVFGAEKKIAEVPEHRYLFFRNRKILDLDPNDVVRLTLETTHERLTCKQEGTKWTLVSIEEKEKGTWKKVEEFNLMIEDSYVDNMVGGVCKLTADEYVAKNPSNLAKYGLNKPFRKVSVKLKTGREEKVLLGRAKTEKGREKVFCMLAGHPYVFTPSRVVKNKLTGDLISSYLANFAVKEVDKVTMTYGGTTYEFVKGGSEWYLAESEQSRIKADRNAIEDLIRRLGSMKGNIERYHAVSLKEYGLERPLMRMILTVSEQPLEFRFANPKEDTCHATVGDVGVIYAVKAETARKVVASPVKYISKDLLKFTFGKLKAVRIRRGNEKIVLKKDKRNNWFCETAPDRKVNVSKMNKFLFSLLRLKAVSVAALGEKDISRFGLEEPYLTITLSMVDGKSTGIRVGQTNKKIYYVSRLKENTVFTIGKSAVDSIDKPLDYFFLGPAGKTKSKNEEVKKEEKKEQNNKDAKAIPFASRRKK